MERIHLRGVILASLIASGFGGGPAWGGEHFRTVATPVDANLSIARFYTSPMVNIGQFPGTLVRLSCASDAKGKPTNPSGRQRYDYGLVIDGDDVIHPLLLGSEEARSELDSVALHGTDVAVHGKYYPSTGSIFVSRIALRTAEAAHGGVAAKARTDAESTVELNTVRDTRLAACASH